MWSRSITERNSSSWDVDYHSQLVDEIMFSNIIRLQYKCSAVLNSEREGCCVLENLIVGYAVLENIVWDEKIDILLAVGK